MKEILMKYGILYAIAGAIGAVVLRFKRKMNWAAFLGLLVFSSFTGWVVGVSIEHYLKLPQEVMYAFCAVCGVFSDEIYKEISEFVSSLSEVLKKVVNKYLGE